MTSRSKYVKHWFDIKVLSVRILLKVAWELTHRYFIFVFSWGSILSFRFDFGNYSNRILTLLQLYDEVSERSSLRSIQLHIAESQQRHDSNKNFINTISFFIILFFFCFYFVFVFSFIIFALFHFILSW
jgi:hypothetical protein